MNESVNIAAVDTNSVSREERVFTKTDKIMSAVSTVLAFLFIEFAVIRTTGFVTTAVYVALITFSIVFMRKKGCKFTKYNVLMAAVLYLFAFVFSLTDSGFIKFLDSVFLFFAGAYFVYSAAEGKTQMERYLPFAMLKALFEFPFSHFGTQALVTKECVKTPGTAAGLRNLLLGLIMAFPLTFIVGILLVSADAGMENFFTELVFSSAFYRLFNYGVHFMIALPCSLYLFGLVYSNSSRKGLRLLDHELCRKITDSVKFIPNSIGYTAVTPICILYIMFFISQASYFLSAFSGSLPSGYSYSEYARRGFFELVFVAVINLTVICLMSLFSKKGGSEKPKALKFYNITLSVFTLILITVAMSKMVMYISISGLTRLRLYTSWFMLLCAAIFILIIIKQFRFNFRFTGWCTGIFTVMFAVLCFGHPDWAIAKYNIEMYNAGYLEDLDTGYLVEMSDDAVLTALESGVLSNNEVYSYTRRRSSDNMRNLNIPSLILRSALSKYDVKELTYPDFKLPKY